MKRTTVTVLEIQTVTVPDTVLDKVKVSDLLRKDIYPEFYYISIGIYNSIVCFFSFFLSIFKKPIIENTCSMMLLFEK